MHRRRRLEAERLDRPLDDWCTRVLTGALVREFRKRYRDRHGDAGLLPDNLLEAFPGEPPGAHI